MSENNNKKNDNYYFLLFMSIGLALGIIFDQLAVGLCLGMAIGLSLDNRNKKID